VRVSLPFLLRRGATQSALLAAVLAVVVAGAVLLGTCALLLTTGQEAALDMALRGADTGDIEVEAAFRMADGDPRGVVVDATEVLTDALAPVDPVISTWLTSDVRPLSIEGASEGHGYVVEAAEIVEHADLLDGRWPTASPGDGPLEVAVPGLVANRLGLATGSTLVLEELRDGTVTDEPVPGSEAVELVVVGTYAAILDESGVWDRDVLRGGAVDPTWQLWSMMKQPPVTAYGPFVTAPGTLLGATVAVDRASLVALPDLANLDAASRDAVRAGVGAALRDLRDTLGDRTRSERLTTGLARTIAAAEIQQRVTGSAMLVVALLGTALAAAALALAGRLVTVRRNAEARLLAARGANRAQLVGQAATESVLLALVAAALALPLTVVLYRWLSGLPPMADAGLTRDVRVTPTLVLTVAVAALALAAVLVAPSVRAPDRAPHTRRSARGRVARSSVDALLVALAVVGYLELRGRPFADGGGPDPVLVAAPVLSLVAGAALALRIVPLVSRWAERRATRSRRLVVPLASWEIARRRHSTGAALLLVLAAAGATFSVSLGDTWSVSAKDQADTQVGTDLAVGLTEGSTVAQARGLATVTGGDLVPVTDREIALGAVGDDTALSETRMVAVDTARADELLRGRLVAGSTWSELTSGLAPDEPVAGIALPTDADGVRLTVTGSVAGAEAWDMALTILPTVVVQTAGGAREEIFGWEVPLDGQAHELVLPLPRPPEGVPSSGGVHVVALDLRVARGSAFNFERIGGESARLTVNATVAASGSTTPVTLDDGRWSASVAAGSVDRLKAPGEVVLSEHDGEVGVAGTAALYAIGLFIGDAELVLHGFVPQTEVPVLINRDLADAVAAQPGDALSLDVGGATVTGRVVAVVPEVVAFPRGADILTDHDALSRASLGQGSLASLTDRWWVAGVADADAAAQAITDAGLGKPTTRSGVAEVLRRDPLRIGLQMSLWLLVAAAGVLAVAGTVVQTAAALEARAVDVARLQGMGVPRRAVVAALLVEHGVVNLLVVAAGGAVGWVASSAVGPFLVVASNGRAPVPSALPQWSWAVQGLVLGVLALACAATVAPVAASLVRRATVTHLRMDGAT
jgi:hypothetical protein